MQTVILVVHILACIAMIGVILLQKSEGGALGIGGGSGGGLMSGRGAAGALVRTTMIFGAVFFVTSLALTTIANSGREDAAPELQLERGGLPGAGGDSLDPLSSDLFGDGDRPAAADPLAPATPVDETPADADPLAPAETAPSDTSNPQ